MSLSRTLLVLFSILALPVVACAHGLGVEVARIGETVRVTASFDTDDPADDCVVTVTAADGRVAATGKTDAKGEYTFPTPPNGEYVIVADAGAGHVAKKTLTVAASATDVEMNESGTSKSRKWLGVSVGLIVVAVGTVFGKRIVAANRKGRA